MRAPGASGVPLAIPALARAAELTHTVWPQWRISITG